MREAPASDESRTLKLLSEIAAWVGMALLTLVVIVLIIVAVLPRVSGWHFVMVAGGSMEPTIPYGSVAVMKEIDDARGLPAGKIIEYRSPDTGIVTTHRIVEATEGGDAYVTRGDANNVNDRTPVPAENVIGEYRFHIPNLAHWINWLQSPTGLLTLVWIPGMLLIANEVRNVIKHLFGRKAEG